jgi:hypothetical protein
VRPSSPSKACRVPRAVHPSRALLRRGERERSGSPIDLMLMLAARVSFGGAASGSVNDQQQGCTQSAKAKQLDSAADGDLCHRKPTGPSRHSISGRRGKGARRLLLADPHPPRRNENGPASSERSGRDALICLKELWHQAKGGRATGRAADVRTVQSPMAELRQGFVEDPIIAPSQMHPSAWHLASPENRPPCSSSSLLS